MTTKTIERTSRGGHETQLYKPALDPAVTYEIEHNHTDYWVKLSGQVVAFARFQSEVGKDPGWNFTHEKAIQVIDAFYQGAHDKAYGPDEDVSYTVKEALWRSILLATGR